MHRAIFTSLCILILGLGLFRSIAAPQSFEASMIGSVGGTVTTTDGRQVAPQAGPPHVDVSYTVTNGQVVATITGSIACTGGSGVYLSFTSSYNAATGSLSGTYTTNSPGSTAQPIEFVNTGDLTWRARVQGSTSSSTGARPFNITVDINLPNQAIYAAGGRPHNTRYSDTFLMTTPASITLPAIPAIGFAGTTETMNITASGSWQATAVPTGMGSSVITGRVTGTVRGDRTLSIPVSIPGYTYYDLLSPISVSIDSRFGGTISGSVAANNVLFSGNWTSQSGDSHYGGEMTMTIPINVDGMVPFTVPLRITGSISPSLPSFSYLATAPIVPLDITTNVPLNITSN